MNVSRKCAHPMVWVRGVLGCLLVMLWSPLVFAGELRWEGTTLVGTADDGTAWSLPLGVDAEEERNTEATRFGPLELNGVQVVSVGAEVLWVDAAAGRVVERLWFPGRVNALTRNDDGALVVGCSDNDGPVTWHEEWTCATAADCGQLPLPSQAVSILRAERDAWKVVRTVAGVAPDLDLAQLRAPLEQPTLQSNLAAALARLDEAALRDPTNPWYLVAAADYAEAMGDAEGAARRRRAVEQVQSSGTVDLLRISGWLLAQEPELSDALFARGLAAVREHGYEPDQAYGLVGVVLWLGERPAEDADWDTLLRWASRLEQFAPVAEGVAGYFQAVGDRARGQGDIDMALHYENLAAAAVPNLTLGGFWMEGYHTSLALDLGIAGMLAMALAVIARLFRIIRGRSRGVGAAAVARSEAAGILMLVLLTTGLFLHTSAGVARIGAIAGAPLSAFSGFREHPANAAWWGAHDLEVPLGPAWQDAELPVDAPGWVDPGHALSLTDGPGVQSRLATGGLVLAGLLALAWLAWPRPAAPAAPGPPSSVVEFLVPGTHRGWNVAGPFATWVVVWGIWITRVWLMSDGTSLTTLDTIALPAFGAYFPIWTAPAGVPGAWLVVVPWVAALVWIANAAAVGRSLFARSTPPSGPAPSPAGPPP